MKRVDADGHDSNLYSDGDPQQAIAPTLLRASEMNAMQEEICNTIELQGLTLDSADDTQLHQAIGSKKGQFTLVTSQSSAANITGVIADKTKNYNWSFEASLKRRHDDLAGVDDSAFYTNLGGSFNSALTGIAIDKDDNIIAIGAFSNFDSNGLNYVTKLDKDGNEDTEFTDKCANGPSSLVYGVDTDSLGNIYLAGVFGNWNGASQFSKFIKLYPTGIMDHDFANNMGGGLISTCNTVKVQSDGKILVGGTFTATGYGTRNRLVRINPDGTEDAAFYTNLGGGFNGAVSEVQVQSDGKILVLGAFTQLNSITRNYVVRLNGDGTVDTAFYTNLGSSFNEEPYVMLPLKSGKILFGGAFATLNAVARTRIVCLNDNGTVDTTFYGNVPASITGATSVQSFLEQKNGRILVGGDLTSLNLLELEAVGTEVSSFTTNMGTGFDSNVTKLEKQSDGKIIVGGPFTDLDGNTRNYMLSLSGDFYADEKIVNTIQEDSLGVLSLSEEYREGDLSGITLSIDSSTGQIKYTSTTMTGTEINSYIYYALRNNNLAIRQATNKSDGIVKMAEGSKTNVVIDQENSGDWKDSTGLIWNGTAPTTLVFFKYKWIRTGKIVHFVFEYEYGAGGSTTGVKFNVPSEIGNVVGYRSQSTPYPFEGGGRMTGTKTFTGTNCRLQILNNATSQQFHLTSYNASAVNAKYGNGSITYFIN